MVFSRLALSIALALAVAAPGLAQSGEGGLVPCPDSSFNLLTAAVQHCRAQSRFEEVCPSGEADVERIEALKTKGLVLQTRRRVTVRLALAALASDIPGDFVETGTYTGGTSALMLYSMKHYDFQGRKMWAADSFGGLPASVAQDDVGGDNSVGKAVGSAGMYSASLMQFKQTLHSVGVLDRTRLNVLKGWFNETLPTAPIDQIAFLRLDGDLYESTKDALDSLYDKLVVGGIIYLDDYGSFPGCQRAVDEFRLARGYNEPMFAVPNKHLNLYAKSPRETKYEAVWWVKGSGPHPDGVQCPGNLRVDHDWNMGALPSKCWGEGIMYSSGAMQKPGHLMVSQ